MSILLLKPGNAGFMARMKTLLKMPLTENFSLYSRDKLLMVSRHFGRSGYANLHTIRQYFGGKNVSSDGFYWLIANIGLPRIILAKFDCTEYVD